MGNRNLLENRGAYSAVEACEILQLSALAPPCDQTISRTTFKAIDPAKPLSDSLSLDFEWQGILVGWRTWDCLVHHEKSDHPTKAVQLDRQAAMEQ